MNFHADRNDEKDSGLDLDEIADTDAGDEVVNGKSKQSKCTSNIVAGIQEKLCNYIPGQSKTIDSGHLLWLGYSVWQSDRQTNNFNHIDFTTS
jgi:hypothetical protein